MDRSELHGKRLGMAGRVAVLRSLVKKPAPWPELVQRDVVGATAAITFVNTLHALGMLRIVGWRQTYKAPLLPIFGMGPGEDAPLPAKRSTGQRAVAVAPHARSPRLSPAPSELLAFFHLYEALQAPSTPQEIAEETGLYRATVAKALRSLHEGAPKLAYVADWRRQLRGGEPIPLYAWGNKRDAPRPKAIGKAKRQSALRANARHKALIPGDHPLNLMARQLAANDATAQRRA